MKNLAILFSILFAFLAIPTFAQHVRADVDRGQSKSYQIGDVMLIGGELGVVFVVTPDGQHGKVVSTSQTQATWSDAKAWCASLGHGWRLPSRDELNAIFNKRSELNTHLKANGFTGLGGGYWSSEASGSSDAWYIVMTPRITYSYDKNINGYVRAVSAF